MTSRLKLKVKLSCWMLVSALAFSATSKSLADDPPTSRKGPTSVAEILTENDRQLVKTLLAYIEANPKGVDLDQAYMSLFNKVIEYDWFLDFEKPALAYLAKYPDGPLRSLAQIVATMARGHAEDFPTAIKRYEELMSGLGKPDQEEFAVNFSDSLANVATAAGQFDVSRKVFNTLLAKYRENPDLRRKIGDELDRLKLVGKPAPEIIANDVKGDAFRLENVKGKYVLLDFWATWCAPCVADLPNLMATYAKYRSRGFEIIGVNLDETKDALIDFTTTRNVPWRQIHNTTSGGDVVDAYGVSRLPSTFLLDPKGTLIRLELKGKSLDKVLETLLPPANGADRPKQATP